MKVAEHDGIGCEGATPGVEQRISIRFGFRDRIGADHGRGARLVFDDDGLTETLGPMLSNDACGHVCKSPRRGRNHAFDLLYRVSLRTSWEPYSENRAERERDCT